MIGGNLSIFNQQQQPMILTEDGQLVSGDYAIGKGIDAGTGTRGTSIFNGTLNIPLTNTSPPKAPEVKSVADFYSPGGIFSNDKKPGSAQAKAAHVIREKYDASLGIARPIEQQIISDLYDPNELSRQVFESRGLIQRGFNTGRNAAEDYRSRYGDIRTPEEIAFEERKSQIRQALAEADASTQTREIVGERDFNTSVDLTRIGRGMAATAQQGLTSAASAEASREASNEAAKSADRSSTVGNTLAGAGLGYALAGAQAGGISGPAGAAIGAGIGLVSSLLIR